jgi:hypothetical protein
MGAVGDDPLSLTDWVNGASGCSLISAALSFVGRILTMEPAALAVREKTILSDADLRELFARRTEALLSTVSVARTC